MVRILVFAVYASVSAFGLYKIKVHDSLGDIGLWIGILSYGAGFLIWIYILRTNPLSVAFPIAASSLIVATQVVGLLWLGERITPFHIVGTFLVAAGIVTISLAQGK